MASTGPRHADPFSVEFAGPAGRLRVMLSGARMLVCLLGAWMAFCGRAVEPWTDPRLPVTHGVVLWLDASRQTAGRGAHGLSPLRSWADAPEVLFDGSGHRRHFLQPLREARPTFRIDWGTTALAFDGTNDHLTAFLPGSALREVSGFIVASPHAVGGFQGLLSANALGRNDYLTGFNLDFGAVVSTNLLAALNLEGPGFSGEQNLLLQPPPLRQWHRFAFFVGGSNGVQAYLDGEAQKSRPRSSDVPLSFEEVTLGARRYSNTPDRPHAQGFFQGWLTEVILYDRVLTDSERNAVEQYLDAKYGAVLHGTARGAPPEGEVPLVTVAQPPPVQVHYPGFAVEELPVRLNNVNNLRYRPDGVLVAVGYDGRLWLLRDSNGDGAEDEARVFFDGRKSLRAPIGAALTPPGYARGNGLFVAAKDRLALLVDTDGDDQADQDITVATWTETSIQQGVDALGVAVAPDGSVYFSLGSASFIEPFLIDSGTGKAGYHTRQERGTILRVSPDFSKREIVCTGIRFAVGMAFNRVGDLFVTDQEGATWRHDGNPLDELLHIQPGRHYGFPPRHPRHLPGVFDEPSVFDYGPQHQSTCGLAFNAWAGVSRESWFGPGHWRDDAFVAGYSRGKLWKTKLVKTDAGYVAQTDLIATLQQLTVDATVSAAGDLIVATHSGQPDWGSGPNGPGHLWRIRYQEPDTPQPVVAWNASPTELRIAFDGPLPAQAVKDLSERARIEGGPCVYPGDRFETVRPGYQVVYDQLAAPRRAHEILTSQVSPDRRTLTLVTRPRDAAVHYAVTLPGPSDARGETDLLTRLNGVEAEWSPPEGGVPIRLWLPHPDLAVAEQLTAGSAEHERFFAALRQPGRLVLRGQLDLWQMLQPAIQPGAAIDWVRPPETVHVQFRSPADLEVRMEERPVERKSSDAGSQYDLEIRAPGQDWHAFELRMPTGGEASLTATWSTDEDPRARAFPLRRFFSPWAKRAGDSNTVPPTRAAPDPALAGGHWLPGRRLFFSDRLGCAKCHRIRGEGARVGPELSNLIHRDAASVRKDIEFPNASINPDHVASVIEGTDGESFTAIILEERQGILRVISAAGAVEEIPSHRVRTTRPSPQSLMPEGLWTAMNESEQRDLMTFLLHVPLEPYPAAPEIQGHERPPPRARAAVESFVGAGTLPAADTNTPAAPLRIVLCASAKDPGHGAPGFHDYPLWRERWSRLLDLADGVTVETADRWPSEEQWQAAQIVAFYHDNPAWAAGKAADLDAFLARGGGLVFLHWSLNAYRDMDALKERLGRAWGAGGRYRHGVEDLKFSPHAITAGLPAASRFTDESYWNLPGADAGSTVLAVSPEDGQDTPQIWIREAGQGRIFVCIPGHFTWTFDDPLYRVLLLRGIAWSARQPLDRFLELVPVGARFEP